MWKAINVMASRRVIRSLANPGYMCIHAPTAKAWTASVSKGLCTTAPAPANAQPNVAAPEDAPVSHSADSNKSTETIVVDDEALQEEWKAMERRVAHRKLRPKDGSGPTGRSKRNPSAWDAENNT